MISEPIQSQAHKLVERLPENCSGEDLMHEIYVRQAIESGLADSRAGRTEDVHEVRKEFGLEP